MTSVAEKNIAKFVEVMQRKFTIGKRAGSADEFHCIETGGADEASCRVSDLAALLSELRGETDLRVHVEAKYLEALDEIEALKRHLAYSETRRCKHNEIVEQKDLKARVSGLLSQVADLDRERKSLRVKVSPTGNFQVVIRPEHDICKECGRVELQFAKDDFYSVDCVCTEREDLTK